MLQRLFVALVLVVVASAASAARAEEPEAPKSSAAVTLVEFENVMTAAGCRADAIADPRFVADAKNAIRPLIHAEDANAMLTNKKHVVYAYAALLALLVAFILFLTQRQRGLSTRLSELEAEFEQALEDEGK